MLKGTLTFSWTGMNLQTNDSSASPELPSEAKIFRPVLQPSESIPPIGIYSGKGEKEPRQWSDFHKLTHNILFHKCERVFCAQGPMCWTLWMGNLASKLPWEWSTSSPNRRSEGVGHVSNRLVFQHILHNMCVSVSICVGEVSRARLTTPNCQGKSCQLFFRADCRCEIWCDKKTVSFLLCFRRGTLTWTAAGSTSVATVATRRLFYPLQCLAMQPVCSSPSQR